MSISDTDIRRAAMDLLARREHGAKELSQKLAKRFAKSAAREQKHSAECPAEFPFDETPEQLPLEERIELAVARLTAEGLQSDERLAEAFIRSRANRGQGPIKIKAELRQKGLADQIIAHAMSECEQDWFELAAEVSAKKFQQMPLEAKDRAKRNRFLQQRGFSFDHISSLDGG